MATHLLRLQTKVALLKQAMELLHKVWEESKHPRDNRGRFTSGGGGNSYAFSESELKRIKQKQVTPQYSAQLQKHGQDLAGQLGFSPRRVRLVDINQAPKTPHGETVAFFSPEASGGGNISLVAASLYNAFGTDFNRLDGTMAHEVMHAKFHRFLTDAKRSSEAQRSYNQFLSAHGGDMPTRRALARADGVTAYSRAYWTGEVVYNDRKFQAAMHETLAEMARTEHKTGRLPGSPIWKDLYHRVDHYSRRHM